MPGGFTNFQAALYTGPHWSLAWSVVRAVQRNLQKATCALWFTDALLWNFASTKPLLGRSKKRPAQTLPGDQLWIEKQILSLSWAACQTVSAASKKATCLEIFYPEHKFFPLEKGREKYLQRCIFVHIFSCLMSTSNPSLCQAMWAFTLLQNFSKTEETLYISHSQMYIVSFLFWWLCYTTIYHNQHSSQYYKYVSCTWSLSCLMFFSMWGSRPLKVNSWMNCLMWSWSFKVKHAPWPPAPPATPSESLAPFFKSVLTAPRVCRPPKLLRASSWRGWLSTLLENPSERKHAETWSSIKRVPIHIMLIRICNFISLFDRDVSQCACTQPKGYFSSEGPVIIIIIIINTF